MINILYHKQIYVLHILYIIIYIYIYIYNYYRTSLKYDKLSVPRNGMIPRIDWRLKSDLSIPFSGYIVYVVSSIHGQSCS